MESVAVNNYYLFKSIIVGANRTGKTTFIRQMQNGSPEVVKEQLNPNYYKTYDRINGKLRVQAEIQDMPGKNDRQTMGFYS